MTIQTEFHPIDRNGQLPPFTVEMPYPVRVGDEVEEFWTGRNFRVTRTTWILPEPGQDGAVYLMAFVQ